jgi:sugar lactone lactonase YvrE
MQPRTKTHVFAFMALAIILAGHATLRSAGPLAIASATYEEVRDWAQLPPNTKWGEVAWVDIDAKGLVYAFQRADRDTKAPANVLVFNADGRFLRSMAREVFRDPHGLRILRDGAIWATDRRMHQIFKLDSEGRVLFSLGKKDVAGDMTSTDAFNGPADVAMAENGELFIADGEGPNTRIVKLSKDGTFIKMWGAKGAEPGQFQTPHCVVTDSRGRIWVCDRGNKRVQIFDRDGKFLEQSTEFGAPAAIYITKDNTVYVAAGAPDSSVTIATLDGKVTDRITGLQESPHALAVASDGTIYVASANQGRGNLVKLVKKK